MMKMRNDIIKLELFPFFLLKCEKGKWEEKYG